MREIEDLKKQLTEIQTKIEELEKGMQFERVEKDEKYFAIHCGMEGATTIRRIEEKNEYDDSFYNSNNYFRTEERAEEVAKSIRVLLKLWRLHDTLCEDYVPIREEDKEQKWVVFYSYPTGTWCEDWWINTDYNAPCFPTKELAQKACDILNEEGFKP